MSVTYKLLIVLFAMSCAVLSQAANAIDLTPQVTVSGLTLVKQSRISRTVFEYTYKINISNSGVPLTNVVASFNSKSAAIQVLDGTINLGDLPGYAKGASKDTFSIRLDRVAAIDKSAFTWLITGDAGRNTCSNLAITPIQPSIQKYAPTSAPTGSSLIINGSGFHTCSRGWLANKEVVIPKVLSGSELEIIVPFNVNDQNQLIPLAPGSYPLKVDTSAAFNIDVSELPSNPNPAGQLLNQSVDAVFNSMSQSLPEFETILPQLLVEAEAQPGKKKFIQDLFDLASYINGQGQAKASQLIGQIDSQSLDTLERAALANQKSTITYPLSSPSSQTQQSLQLNNSNLMAQNLFSSSVTECISKPNGEEWLSCRLPQVEDIKNINLVRNISNGCAMLIGLLSSGTGTPLVGLVCKYLSQAAFISSEIEEIEFAKKSGIIKSLDLSISNFGADGDSYYKDEDNGDNQYNLYLNNYDNNETNQTANSKNIQEVKFQISNTPDWIDIGNDTISEALSAGSFTVGDPVIDKITNGVRNAAANKFNEEENIPNLVKTINASSGFILQLANSSKDPGCNIYDTQTHYVYAGSNANWIVPDIAKNLAPGAFMHASDTCKYSVKDEYRLESEDKKSTVDFHVKRFPKLEIFDVGQYHTIEYSHPPLSNAFNCSDGMLPCIEYFDITESEVADFKLLSKSVLHWFDGKDELCIDQTECDVLLDFNNDFIPEIMVFTSLFDVKNNIVTSDNQIATTKMICSNNIEVELLMVCPISTTEFEAEIHTNEDKIQIIAGANTTELSGPYNSDTGEFNVSEHHDSYYKTSLNPSYTCPINEIIYHTIKNNKIKGNFQRNSQSLVATGTEEINISWNLDEQKIKCTSNATYTGEPQK